MIRLWTVIDLDVFRRLHNDSGVRCERQDNGDGTYFIAYDIRSFPSELIAAASPMMRVALACGVDAVEPLPDTGLEERYRERRQNCPPPNLQEWVERYGGYHNIPWPEWDKANAEYQMNRRDLSKWP
jgi:hypothetical protein